jgi:ubiquitin carboxyl-terminal hydrolase 5/13
MLSVGVFEHMEDADFNSPIETVSSVSAITSGQRESLNPGDIGTLVSFGFTEMQAKKALRSTSGDIERAAEWLFSHPDDDGSEDLIGVLPAATGAIRGDPVDLASGEYDLIGIISHLGRSTDCGHYVCHLKKNGSWYFFNDDKVAVSTNPPFDCGFLYIFKRRN